MPATDLNPFASEYTALDTQLREMLQEVEQMEAELEWLAGNSSESLSRAVRAVSDELAVAVREASGVDVLRRRIRSGRALLEMKKRKVPLDQAGILTLEQELEAEENKLESSDKLVVNKKLELERLHEAQHRLATGDPARLTARRDALKKKIASIQPHFVRTKLQYERVAAVIAPFALQFDTVEQRHADLRADLARANDLQGSMEHASTRGRAMIHEQFKNLFGDSSPARVIRKITGEEQAAAREFKKLRTRIAQLVNRETRTIGTLIIDGSNFCYQDGEFCGLAPLKALVDDLSGKFPVQVIFDDSVRCRLNMSAKELSHQLPTCRTHVAAPGQQADELILDLAEAPTAFVISNDQFKDYRDKGVVREKRVIRHEIMSGRLFIHELGVDVLFAHDGEQADTRQDADRGG